MALDGIFLRFVKNEIEKKALYGKVDKIGQPSDDEIIISLRGRSDTYRLLFNCGGNCQRVSLSEIKPENPQTPPMLCMLLRKYLSGGTLNGIRQNGIDRVLLFDFSCIEELGDRTTVTVAAELTGRCGNVILLRENGNIIDSVKRADLTASSSRCILPGMKYEMLPRMDKADISKEEISEVVKRVLGFPDERLSKSILSSVEGISPLVANEIAVRVMGNPDGLKDEMGEEKTERLRRELYDIKERLNKKENSFYILYNERGVPKDFSYMRPSALPEGFFIKEFGSPTELLETFFAEKIRRERTTTYTAELRKFVNTRLERLKRKILAQENELRECAERERLRITGELITANIYRIKKGDGSVEVENYYCDPPETVVLKLDKRLTPSQNAQKYYKEYNKLSNAEVVLTEMIEKGRAEEEYLESVADALTRVSSESDAALIREELTLGGYIRDRKKKQKKITEGEFKREITSDGFEVLIGRNNIQNDKLTMKTAEMNDIWLHTQKIPGSHVIIRVGEKTVSDSAIYEAAVLAAQNSKASEAGKVPVDFALRRFVKKPAGAKPGKVIYTNYKTIYVSPKGRADGKLSDNT